MPEQRRSENMVIGVILVLVIASFVFGTVP